MEGSERYFIGCVCSISNVKEVRSALHGRGKCTHLLSVRVHQEDKKNPVYYNIPTSQCICNRHNNTKYKVALRNLIM